MIDYDDNNGDDEDKYDEDKCNDEGNDDYYNDEYDDDNDDDDDENEYDEYEYDDDIANDLCKLWCMIRFTTYLSISASIYLSALPSYIFLFI